MLKTLAVFIAIILFVGGISAFAPRTLAQDQLTERFIPSSEFITFKYPYDWKIVEAGTFAGVANNQDAIFQVFYFFDPQLPHQLSRLSWA